MEAKGEMTEGFEPSTEINPSPNCHLPVLGAGIEPTTDGVSDRYSTAELPKR
jgi:hypothetical protein